MCKQFRTLNSSVLPVMKCASPAKVVFNALQLAGENGLAFQPPQSQYRTFDWLPPLRKNLRDCHYSVIPGRAITKIRLTTGSFAVDRAGLARYDSKSPLCSVNN